MNGNIRGKVQCFLMGERIKKLRAQQKVLEVRLFVEEARRKQAEYEERYNHNHDPESGRFTSADSGLTKSKINDKIKASGAISGALNRYSKEAQEHAERYYEAVRHMKTDVSKIAHNTGMSEKDIQEIKNFIFLEKHDLNGEYERFAPDYSMAQSWQRLIEGKDIKKHDITLLKHEIMERKLIRDGMSQSEAHIITSQKFNYSREVDEYYDKAEKHSS